MLLLGKQLIRMAIRRALERTSFLTLFFILFMTVSSLKPEYSLGNVSLLTLCRNISENSCAKLSRADGRHPCANGKATKVGTLRIDPKGYAGLIVMTLAVPAYLKTLFLLCSGSDPRRITRIRKSSMILDMKDRQERILRRYIALIRIMIA